MAAEPLHNDVDHTAAATQSLREKPASFPQELSLPFRNFNMSKMAANQPEPRVQRNAPFFCEQKTERVSLWLHACVSAYT
jgi:hypothetical protein